MTKQEELKVLNQIEKLIKSTGDDSYITMTFKGIVDVAKSNIENDFGDCPVEDLEAARKKAEMLDGVAHKALLERDAIKADFDELSAAYRDAVQAIQAAVYYVHVERNALRDAVDNLPTGASDEEIAGAVREHNKAREAQRRCTEVLEASRRKPLCFSVGE